MNLVLKWMIVTQDDECVHEIDNDDSDLDVSGVVSNVQEEPSVRFMNSILLSGL